MAVNLILLSFWYLKVDLVAICPIPISRIPVDSICIDDLTHSFHIKTINHPFFLFLKTNNSCYSIAELIYDISPHLFVLYVLGTIQDVWPFII